MTPEERHIRNEFDKIRLEGSANYANYVRSKAELRRALVKAYLWWRDCQNEPGLLDRLYDENGLQNRAAQDNKPNFGPMLRLMFNKIDIEDRERITIWSWGTAVRALHMEYEDNPKRYRHNAEGKLVSYFNEMGGISGLTKKDEPDEGEEYIKADKQSKVGKSASKAALASQDAIKLNLQQRALDVLRSDKGIGKADTKTAVRVGEHGLLALLARREPNGTITILGSANSQDAVKLVAEQVIQADLSSLPSSLRLLAEIIRSQAYPPISMPSKLSDRKIWRHSVLMDKSNIKTSDLPNWDPNSKQKPKQLWAPKRLLVRGSQNDIILSNSKASSSVVTRCVPNNKFIAKGDEIYLRAMEMARLEYMMETGELQLYDANPKQGLAASASGSNYDYQLELTSNVRKTPLMLHFYDTKHYAGSITAFQADFNFKSFKPSWRFMLKQDDIRFLRQELIDKWFTTLGYGRQPLRFNNIIMQVFVTANRLTVQFNINKDGQIPNRKIDIKAKIVVDGKTFKMLHLSNDLAPVLYNLADANMNGSISVMGNSDAIVFSYANDIGEFQIAVPTATRLGKDGKRAVRNSNAFSEFQYG